MLAHTSMFTGICIYNPYNLIIYTESLPILHQLTKLYMYLFKMYAIILPILQLIIFSVYSEYFSNIPANITAFLPL